LSAPLSENSPKQDLIVFGEEYQRHPHSLEHLIKYLTKDYRVLWVETIGLRSPRFNAHDVARIAELLAKWPRRWMHPAPPAHASDERHPLVIAPVQIPYNQFTWIRRVNRWLLKTSLAKAIRRHQLHPLAMVTAVPQTALLIDDPLFRSWCNIYYCVDEFSLWPGINLHVARAFEETLLQNVDHLIVTSTALFQSKRRPRLPCPEILDHGVDLDHFILEDSAAAPSLHDDRHLRLGLFGLLDERTDEELLSRLLARMPSLRLFVIGKRVCDFSWADPFLASDQIVLCDRVSYEELPRLLATLQLDAFILPYKRNELTRHINPLKLKEYMATGKHVFATPIDEAVKWQSSLHIISDVESCLGELAELLRKKRAGLPLMAAEQRQRLEDYLRSHETWEAKSHVLHGWIQDWSRREQPAPVPETVAGAL